MPTAYAQPNASFSWRVSGLTVSFTAADNGAGASYIWLFGDGSNGDGRTVSHTYAQAADYTVTLFALAGGDQSQTSRTIPASAFNRREDPGRGSRKSADDSAEFGSAYVVHVTCQTLPSDNVRVIPNSSEIQCQIIDSDPGIGNQEIINAGWVAAVDVWNIVRPGTEICFRQSGNMVLLDAATSPRSIVALQVYASDPWLCTRIDRAGTVVLLPGEPARAEDSSTATPTEDRYPVPHTVWSDNSPIVELEDCRVRTRVYVNFRESPAGEQISSIVIPYANSFDAIARTEHWFQVEYMETLGWISAHLVRATHQCAATGEDAVDEGATG